MLSARDAAWGNNSSADEWNATRGAIYSRKTQLGGMQLRQMSFWDCWKNMDNISGAELGWTLHMKMNTIHSQNICPFFKKRVTVVNEAVAAPCAEICCQRCRLRRWLNRSFLKQGMGPGTAQKIKTKLGHVHHVVQIHPESLPAPLRVPFHSPRLCIIHWAATPLHQADRYHLVNLAHLWPSPVSLLR